MAWGFGFRDLGVQGLAITLTYLTIRKELYGVLEHLCIWNRNWKGIIVLIVLASGWRARNRLMESSMGPIGVIRGFAAIKHIIKCRGLVQ